MKNKTRIPDFETFLKNLKNDMNALGIGYPEAVDLLTTNQQQILYHFFYYSVHDAAVQLYNINQVSYETFRQQFMEILKILNLTELRQYQRQIYTFELPLELWKRLTDMFFDVLKQVFPPPYESYQLLERTSKLKFSELLHTILMNHPILFFIAIKHNRTYRKFLRIGWLGGAIETLRAYYYDSFRNKTYHPLDYVIEKVIREQIFISRHDSQILAMYYLKHKDALNLSLKDYAESVRISYTILKQHVDNLADLKKVRVKPAGKRKYNLTEEQIQYIIMAYKEIPSPIIAKNVDITLPTLYYFIRRLREHVLRKLLKKIPLNTTEAVVAEKFFKGVTYERTTDAIPTQYS